ncbi:YcaO-like family protein [Kineococcus sp. LSe6-4]|uniref:YcaO-like family protein n=1 Tax=Kineococcus halophytocola TaxID=3234027 RepID=A0ABV4H293_9ACTN
MTNGPRGLAPRGPWRLLRDPGGGFLLDDDEDRVRIGERQAHALALLRRRGAVATDDLLSDLGVEPQEVPALAGELADLVRSDVLVRTPGPLRPTVAVEGVGRSATAELRAVLNAAGNPAVDAGAADLVVLTCDDHADPRLPDLLTGRARRSAVLLVRWGAGRCWIGPLIGAGGGHRSAGTCPACLVEALRANAEPDLAGAAHPVGAGVPGVHGAAVGAVAAAVEGVLEELARPPGEGACAGGPSSPQRWRAGIRELRLRTCEVVVHPVPPCPGPAPGSGPAEPAGSEPAGSEPAGSEPTGSDLAGRLAGVVSGLTGFLDHPRVRRAASGRFLATTTHPVRPSSGGAGARRRATASGAGRTAEEALTACLGEAVERFSTVWRPDPDAVVTTTTTLRAAGSRVVLPAAGPRPWREDAVTEFRSVRPVAGGAWPDTWVPAAAVTFGHPDRWAVATARPDSTGCAAGGDVPDAVRRGLAELVERDAVADWWWGREPRTGAAHPDPDGIRAALAAHGRRGWFLDLTHRAGIPVAAAVGVLPDGTGTTLGFGTAATLTGAVVRAGEELLQVLACLEFGDEFGLDGAGTAAWRAEHVEDHPHLLPHGDVRDDPTPVVPAPDVRTDWCSRLAAAGCEVGFVELTHPRAAVPVVRVVSPQLRSWRRPVGPAAPGGANPWDLPV